VTTRHEFLQQLHDTLKPRGYLEIGVQYGTSLALAKCPSIGIDPAPMLQGHVKDTVLQTMTSDHFFETLPISSDGNLKYVTDNLDLAFIDGMHLFEYALRDFLNVERYSNPQTVVVFDDVLPRNQQEAARDQCPGDWTGDVWKVPRLLKLYRPDLAIHLVNTDPTGTAVVWNLNPRFDWVTTATRIEAMGLDAVTTVPDDVLNRDLAVSPEWALSQVTAYLDKLGKG
jgi:predicted O-methyltransferase YrrM